MNEFRQQLYSRSFRPDQGPAIFTRANLDPHYWPFKGIVWSLVVHASIFTGIVSVPVLVAQDKKPSLREEAIIIEPDDLKDVLYLPVLAANTDKTAAVEDTPAAKEAPSPGKEGLSYPGPQPVVSSFPNVTNHSQTVLQPTLVSPQILQPPLTLPNLVRLAPPPTEAKFKVPDAATSQVQPPTAPLPLDPGLSANLRPLPAPLAEARFKIPDAANPAARPALPMPMAPVEVPVTATMNPLAAPAAQSRFKLTDPVAPITRPAVPVPVAPMDVPLSGAIHPLAAPAAQPRFKLAEPVAPIVRPALTVPAAGPAEVLMAGPSGPLAAPVAESRFRLPEAAAAPTKQANAAAPVPQMNLPSGPSKPLVAPAAESKFKAAEAVTSVARPNATPATTSLEVSLSGPARPLAAPLAESKFKAAEAVTSVARPRTTPATTPAGVSLSGPARPLAAPLAESKFKTPDAVTVPARPGPTVIAPLEGPPLNSITPLGPPVPPKPIESAARPNDPTQNVLTLSPTPARRDQQAVIPPGEARGQFAISPTPNLAFPGTEPGTTGARGGGATSAPPAVAGVVPPSNLNPTNNRGNSAPAAANNSSNSFPGITILSPEITPTPRGVIPSIGPGPEPLQTSYGIMILASGRSGGGLPDVGVFPNDIVHTVYLDMRKTIVESPVSWTVEFGFPQKVATPTNERLTTVSSQQEILLPFPITKERPVLPADLIKKYSGKLVLAYAVITVEGKMDQVSIKDTPDPLLNDVVLSALHKWTFRPARRDGEIVPAKILLGIPVRAN